MKKLTLSKEQLQKQLDEIAKKEEQEMIETHYPKFKKFEGKFFKTSNCYSCPEKPSDYWWLYTKITEIKPKDIYNTRGNGVASHYTGWSFQVDKYGQISIEREKSGYIHSLGQEITEKEFNAAWDKMIDKINAL